jgi:autotransporter-associated beta strand protein
VTALAGRLPEVAAHYGRTAAELRETLRRDRSLRLDDRANLYFACYGLAVPENGLSDTNGVPSADPIAPLSQTFLLHSRTGATKLIYLDFDGYTLSGNIWTSTYNAGADIVAPPWDTDGNPASFGSSEQTAIQQIWLRVAEDYAPFDVDVTTEYPGEAALTRSSTSDSQYGVRALISPISSYVGNYGGIAYVGVYDNIGDYSKPTLIFPEHLANSEKYIAEAISHEVGHTLGLSHDGTSAVSYYEGQGNWAPIMGVGYYKPISQWSKGEYADANNTEDDLTVITQNGLNYRASDFGTSLATATLLPGPTISTNGIITHAGESDFTSFQTGAGSVQISVVVWERGADLHLMMSLYGSGGALLTNVESVDDGNGTHDVSLNTVVTGGTYYVAVTGKGSGDPLTTGYSNYGSLGHYTLNLTLPAAGSWLPTPAGNFSWTDPANWQAGNIPGAPSISASFTNDIAGNQFITLDNAVTIGVLQLGTSASTKAFTIADGTGGPLTFAVSSGQARLQKMGDGFDEIAASVALSNELVVNNDSLATLKMSGPISGTAGLTKTGAGFLLLAGTNTFTGNLVVSNGFLALDATAQLGTPQIEIADGARLEATNGYTIIASQTLAGRGVIMGDIVFATNATLAAGGIGQAGTLTFSNNLMLGGNALWAVDLANTTTTGGTTNDLVVVAGDLTLAGVNSIKLNLPDGSLESPGVYTLMTYGGTLSGDATNLIVVAGSRYQYEVDTSTPGQIRLNVSGGGATNLTWRGDGTTNLWNVAGAANWFAGTGTSRFFQFDSVVFDDTGSNAPPVSLSSALTPTLVTVNAAQNFTFTGPGNFSGNTALVKLGSGTLTLSNANDFTGPITVSAGRLKPASSTALGSVSGATFITNSGALDLNGLNLGAEPVVVSGAGAGGGAILNNGAAQSNALCFVTLTGDATFGGIGRWDIRANPTATLTGNGYKLTKTGTNEFWLADLGETGLGDIEVRQGLLGLEGSSTAGISDNTLTVWPGATLRLANANGYQLNKALRATNAIVSLNIGSGVATGPVFLNGSNNFSIGSSFEISGPIAGSGFLIKSNAGTLILSGTNAYTGTLYMDTASATTSNGIVRVTRSQALQNFVSPIYFRNTNSGSSTLQLDADVTVAQAIQLSGRNSIVPAIQNLDGSNTLAGGFILQSGGSNFWFQSDRGTLALSGLIPISLPNATARRLTFLGAGAHVIHGTLQNGAGVGSVGITKSGSGDLTLNGTNTYSRGTLLSQGVLYVNSSRAFGTGTITNDTGANTGRIVLGSGVTATNSIVANSVNPGADFGLLTVNGNVSATFSGPITFKNNAVSGGHIAGPAAGDPLRFTGLLTLTAGNSLVIRSGNVRFAGGGSYPEIQVRADNTSLGANNGLAANATLDLAGNGSPQSPTVFDLNGFNQTLTGLKNTGDTNNAAWVTNGSALPSTLTLALGTSNYSFGGGIAGNVALTLNSGTQTLTKSGSTALNGLYKFSGTTTVNGGKLVLGSGIALSDTPVISLAASATLDASASGLTLGAAQTLTGNGTLLGDLNLNGTVSPGFGGIGVLTCSNTVTMSASSTQFIELNRTLNTNDQLCVGGTLNYGGTLVVTNRSGLLAGGDAFKLFSATAFAGNFASLLGSPGPGLTWSFAPATGVLSVYSTVPAELSATVAAGNLQLAWPADHLGWRLQAQTNSLITGLGTNWMDVADSGATNQMTLPIDAGSDSVFYRLIFP